MISARSTLGAISLSTVSAAALAANPATIVAGAAGATTLVVVAVAIAATSSKPTDAGADQTVTLPIDQVVLTAQSNASEVAWRQVGGPVGAIIASPRSLTTRVQLLGTGKYTFEIIGRNAGTTKVIGRDRVVVTVLRAPPGTPGVASWRPLAIGAGGFITGIDLHRDGVERVIRTDTYGAYLWANNRWNQLVTATSMPADERLPTGGGVTDVVIAPTSTQRLYMYYNSRFYRSDNRGASWTRSAAFGVAEANANDDYRTGSFKIAVDPVNADIVYVGTRDDGMRRSVDGGLTWTTIGDIPVGVHRYNDKGQLTDTGGGISIFFDPSGGGNGSRTNIVYASSWGNGIWRSADGGNSWQRIADGNTGPIQAWRSEIASDGTLFAIDRQNGSGGVWRYRAGAWTNVSPTNNIQTLTVDPSNPNRVYAFSGSGEPWRTVDGGAHWTQLAAPGIRTATGDVAWHAWTSEDFFSTGQARFDPKVPGKIWMAQGIGVWTAQVDDTTNRLTWQATSRGVEQLVINDVIAPPGGRPVTAAWDRAIFYSESVNTFPATHGPTFNFNSAWDLDWSPANPKFIVANTSDHRYCCTDQRDPTQAGWSIDGGKTWTEFASFPQIDASINPGNPTIRLGYPHQRFGFGDIAVAANNIDNIMWLPSWNRQPAYTLNRGATWNIVRLPGEVNDEYNSHFGNFLNRKVLVADRVLASTFYYYNADGTNIRGVWRTSDGGKTWSRVFEGAITNFSVFNATLGSVPGKAGHLFFTPGQLQGDPDIALKRSIDGGATWTDVPGASRVHAFGFGKPQVAGGYPTIFIAGTVGGKYGIYRSTDEGATWQSMGFPHNSLDTVRVIDGDKSVFGRVYVGFAGSGATYGDMS